MTTHTSLISLIAKRQAAAATYLAAVMAEGPAAYWRMDTIGSPQLDVSGNSRSIGVGGAPAQGQAGLLSGDSNTCMAFNGSNSQYLQIAAAAWIDTLHGFECIYQPAAVGIYQNMIDRDDGTNRSWQFRITNGNKLEALWWNAAGAGPTFLTGTTTIAVSTKYHFGFWLDASNIPFLTINGAIEATGSVITGGLRANGSVGLTLGRYSGAIGNQACNGKLDEVAVYAVAPSTTRIAAHAALV